MGTISLYSKLIDNTLAKQPVPVKQPEDIMVNQPIIPDAVTVTLVEFDSSTKDAITAHHIKDYRRKRFNLRLLPKVDILFDKILEGSPYWDELLHNESAYS